MNSFAHNCIASMYRVEVSGWDKHRAFFVEKSELEWNEGSGKYVLLRRAIPDGAVVFLRAIACFSTDRCDAVAYETQFVTTLPEGLHRFRLHRVRPRGADRDSEAN